jgi:DNA repair ATPase RecN
MLDEFVKNYREALDRQYETNSQALAQQRENTQRSIMAGANKMGMLYSNFPVRDKMIYDQQTYLPSQVKLQQTYRTGLDKLRENYASMSNQLKNLNEAIAELNAT